jgi:hypothetical protein
VSDLTWDQALAWKLQRQHLTERVPRARMLDVVSDLCGVQAQVMSSAELALWARVDGLRPQAVRDALWKKRTLVKLWAMRGTLHLLAARDYPVWQAALASLAGHRRKAWLNYLKISERQYDRLVGAVGAALDGDEGVTRTELAERVARAMRSKAMGELVLESWGGMLKPASFLGQLCFGPSAGQNVRFCAPEAWIGAWDPVDPTEAEVEAVRRWFSTYGPATREDYTRWWGPKPSAAQVQKLIESELTDELAPVSIEGTKAWMPAADVDAARAIEPSDGVQLVPGFDQWTINATRGNPAFLDPALKDRVYRQAGWLSPVLLVRGRMAGVWRHEKQGKRLVVTVEPFAKLAAKVKKVVATEADRLAEFVGGEPELRWG